MPSPVEFIHGTNLTRTIFEIIEMAADGSYYGAVLGRTIADPGEPWREARDKLRGIWHLHHHLNDYRFTRAIDRHIDECDKAITDPEMRAMMTRAVQAARSAA